MRLRREATGVVKVDLEEAERQQRGSEDKREGDQGIFMGASGGNGAYDSQY